MTLPAIVVVGDVVTDVVARTAADIAPDSDTAASITTRGGGSGGNVAAWLAAAGARVHLVGRIGDDHAGRALSADLQADGVTTHLAVDPVRPTGTIVVLVAHDGRRTMLSDRGASLRLTPADIPVRPFAAGAHLHLSGYALLDERPRAAALHALTTARAAGMTTSVDPASWRPLAAMGADRFREWIADVDLCLPNVDEARVLTGCNDPASAARDLALFCREAVVTAGAAGAVWSDGTSVLHQPALAATVVDTTGAGDAFAAGYLAARVLGASPAVCLTAGAALAARAVAVVGGRPERRLLDGLAGKGSGMDSMVRVWLDDDFEVQHYTTPPSDDVSREWAGSTVCGSEGALRWIPNEAVDGAAACVACVAVAGLTPPLEGEYPGPV